jgi:hypothetical protein
MVICLGANTVKIQNTKLEWQDNIKGSSTLQRDWRGAIEYCQKLTLDNRDDWRLPSLKELLTIVDITKYEPAIIDGFRNVSVYKEKGYWSSTFSVIDSSSAWHINFQSGDVINWSKSMKHYIRCVRDLK